VGAVGWLDPHGLVLMRIIQRQLGICMHREVECRDVAVEYLVVERGAIPILGWLRDDLAAAETKLWCAVGSRGEDRRIVDERTDGLILRHRPKRRREKAVVEELEILPIRLLQTLQVKEKKLVCPGRWTRRPTATVDLQAKHLT
jgi:hypothetical protein